MSSYQTTVSVDNRTFRVIWRKCGVPNFEVICLKTGARLDERAPHYRRAMTEFAAQLAQEAARAALSRGPS